VIDNCKTVAIEITGSLKFDVVPIPPPSGGFWLLDEPHLRRSIILHKAQATTILERKK
jgi:hypothetical protein